MSTREQIKGKVKLYTYLTGFLFQKLNVDMKKTLFKGKSQDYLELII